MPRTMFDSSRALDIPPGSDLVMGYVDGTYAWSDADWQRFPGRIVVRACIYNDRMDAQVIDLEPGNNAAAAAVPWVKAKWDLAEPPTVYCFSDAGPAGYRISDVRAACDAAGVKRPLILIAQWDGDPSTFDPHGDPEIIGKQYAGSAQTGGHYDASVIADGWPPGTAVPPSPAPASPYVTRTEFDAFRAQVALTIPMHFHPVLGQAGPPQPVPVAPQPVPGAPAAP